MSELFKQIAEKASAYEMDCANILVDLVKTPSYSCKEKEVIQVIKEKMLENGFDEVQIDGLGNVLGRIGNGKRIIAFDAHIDTVYPGELSLWDYDPYDSKVVNNKVRGRGSVDQKGGMASMITAGKIIKEMDLNQDFTIYFTGTVNEEDCDGQCWQYIINESHLKPELVVITEPTNLNIYRGHRGRMEMTVSIKGVSCHGSAPERGDNAVYKMARIALELEKLNEELYYDP
nr:YgeY family selenium metabolism-linked hydrolase [Candidatus Cloacimonadota bacterium]